ncbi:head GIN domain-containing protein [Chloroflexota bacterium]
MKRISIVLVLLLLLAIVLGSIGCNTSYWNEHAIKGSGNPETQEMDYSEFTKIDVSNTFDVDIIEDDSFFVSITIDDNMFEYLEVTQSGDTLYIGLAPNNSYRDITLRATINMPALRELELSGASRGEVQGFSSSDTLELEASGASRFNLDDIGAGNTKLILSGASKASGIINMADGNFDISGASTVELEGTAHAVSLDASGASTSLLPDFIIANADIELSGASTARVNVSDTLDIDASGASALIYIGNPTLGRVNISGFSNLRRD